MANNGDLRCAECGASVPPGGSCRDNLYALLLLEAQVPGAPGDVPHFYAVACYGIQHPRSMGYLSSTVSGLRSTVAKVLDGEATLEDARQAARSGARQLGRVTRREGDAVPYWPLAVWPMTVSHVLDHGPEDYVEQVALWARSIVAATKDIDLCTE